MRLSTTIVLNPEVQLNTPQSTRKPLTLAERFGKVIGAYSYLFGFLFLLVLVVWVVIEAVGYPQRFWDEFKWPLGAVGVLVAIVVAILVLALIVSWIFLPFAIFGIKNHLADIASGIQALNVHLHRIHKRMPRSAEEKNEEEGSDDDDDWTL